jgi:DNA-binding IclR family transcriptional regulator
MSKSGGTPSRSLTGKVLDVLGAFRADSTELTLSEISRRSALPLTTAHRIVKELTGRGMLERSADGSYHIGLMLWEIASLAPDLQEQVLGGPLDRWTPRTIVSQEELRRVLADVRHNGYSVSDRQVTMDALSVGAPIRAADEEVVASLSLVVHVDGADPAALGAAVRAAARGISRSLGSAAARGRNVQVSTSPLVA